MVKDAKKAFGKIPLTEETVKFSRTENKRDMKSALEYSYKKHFISCKINENKYLGESTNDRSTIFIDMKSDVSIRSCFIYYDREID